MYAFCIFLGAVSCKSNRSEGCLPLYSHETLQKHQSINEAGGGASGLNTLVAGIVQNP